MCFLQGLCPFCVSIWNVHFVETPGADATPLNPCLFVVLCCVRYDGQARGVPGGKHGEARPPLQSLQDEPPPQVRERGGTAALHGQTGKWTSIAGTRHARCVLSLLFRRSLWEILGNSTSAITRVISDQKGLVGTGSPDASPPECAYSRIALPYVRVCCRICERHPSPSSSSPRLYHHPVCLRVR